MDRSALKLEKVYKTLYTHYGPQYWWPAESRFEVILGAILTQNTNWKNVEKAIANLKEKNLLSSKALQKLPQKRLATLIRPSGYFNIKADRIKSFLHFLESLYGGDLQRMFREKTGTLREKLLSVKGVGPETADSILLYAGCRPVFVVDAYTRRILSRHGLVDAGIGYEDLRALFESHLEPDLRTFKEFHGLIVWTGKDFCRKRPRCGACPLSPLLEPGQPVA